MHTGPTIVYKEADELRNARVTHPPVTYCSIDRTQEPNIAYAERKDWMAKALRVRWSRRRYMARTRLALERIDQDA